MEPQQPAAGALVGSTWGTKKRTVVLQGLSLSLSLACMEKLGYGRKGG